MNDITHNGFKQYFNCFEQCTWMLIEQILMKYENVTVTGHSLGGAMALLFFVKFHQKFLEAGVNLKVVTFSSPPTASLTKFFDAISITSQTQEAVSLIDWKPLTAIALPFLLQHRSHSAKDRSLSVVGTVSFRARFAMGIELADIQRCGVSINV